MSLKKFRHDSKVYTEKSFKKIERIRKTHFVRYSFGMETCKEDIFINSFLTKTKTYQLFFGSGEG